MGYGEYESYYIRENELMLLLAGQGMTGCCLPGGTGSGLAEHNGTDGWPAETDDMDLGMAGTDTAEGRPAPEGGINSREDVYRILADLYKKSYIEWEGDAVGLLEPAGSLVRLIRDARWCLQIEGDAQDADGPAVKGCYGRGGRRALLGASPLEAGMLRFSLWDDEELLEHLWEAGLFPEDAFGEDGFPEDSFGGDGPSAEDVPERLLSDEILAEVSEEEFRRTQQPRCTVSLRDKTTGEEAASLTVTDQGVFTWIVLQEDGGITRHLYRKEHCKDILRGWFLREAEP